MNTKYTLTCRYRGFGKTDIMILVGIWDDFLRDCNGWTNLEHGLLSETEWEEWQRADALPIYEYSDKNLLSMIPIKGEMAKRNIIGYASRIIPGNNKSWMAEGVHVI